MIRKYYVCPDCGWECSFGEVFWGVIELEDGRCKECGGETEVLERDVAVGETFNVGNKVYSKPLHSDALAISPEQVAEHRRLFPDVEIDSEHRPVFTSTGQHDNYLKKTGFNKKTQKIRKKKGKIIARMK